jgi:ferredoxin-NADP reductase
VVLIAAGIGVTPFMSLLETLAARADLSQPVLLLHGSRDSAHHAFAARIAQLAGRLPRLEVIAHHSRAGADAARAGLRAGRVGAAQVPASWIEADARFYLCGPPAMLRETTLGLRSRGVPRWAIFSESFDMPADASDTPTDQPHRVHFARSGRTVEWTGADRSLLALADRLGLALPGGCRVGQCESCLLHLRSGRVRHRVETAPLEEGTCLACVAVPTSDVEIDA